MRMKKLFIVSSAITLTVRKSNGLKSESGTKSYVDFYSFYIIYLNIEINKLFDKVPSYIIITKISNNIVIKIKRIPS